MATPIINSQIDAINSTLGELADDLVTLRPLVKDVKDSVAASYITDSATGAIASFPDGADGIPVKDLKVAIEPVQSGSGDPSPTNIRPISGRNGAEVTVSPTTDAADGTTYPISWQTEAGTVYGGTLDVTSGVLTVDRAIKDMGTFGWGMATVNGITVFRDNPIASLIPEGANNAISSAYKWVNGMPKLTGANGNGTFVPRTNYWSSSNLRTVVRDDRFSDTASFTAAVTGQTICYKLATPQTYQLSPIEVSTLLGQNNIWANCGDVDVEYRADIKLYINKMIANALNA